MPLTIQQEQSNFDLDLRIKEAELHNKHVYESNAAKIANWKKFLEANPDYPIKTPPGLDLSMPKCVIGIRYVE